ncbi:trypsin-like serine peptidase [Paractinoplanes atraurantiacus]|uniref:Serine protease n=1 Tax=Paractinoplanes atraurantiacus TaxID=1036182 RepID=A0A285K7I7_9ACTN|nr:hypothetical protein [Actinoplanes atraurantiacus]SNY68539.1 hypothetical protein SAMN05421748_13347 [Actinoplanes atraurantiacus]
MRVSPQWQATADRQAAGGNKHRIAGPLEADYALVTLEKPLGSRPQPLGWWAHPRLGGNTRIRAYDAALWQRLLKEKVTLNVCGYPADKCRDQPPHGPATPAQLAACTGHVPGRPEWRDIGSTQWLGTGRLIDPARAPGVLTYDADTAPGHSGSPIWLNWEGYRNLVAIHTGPGNRGSAPPHAWISNRGVPISEALLCQLRAWMCLDRVQPNF